MDELINWLLNDPELLLLFHLPLLVDFSKIFDYYLVQPRKCNRQCQFKRYYTDNVMGLVN